MSRAPSPSRIASLIGARTDETQARKGVASCGYDGRMCRNIHTLFNYEPPATEDEVRDAALQYVRKISGSTKPSRANEEAFALAVEEVTEATAKLLGSLVTTAAPRDREVEAERKRARAAERFAAV